MMHTGNNSTLDQDFFHLLGQELSERTRRPCAHPSFIIYFFVAIVLFSPLGVWLELYVYLLPDPSSSPAQPSDSLRTAVLTFFPAAAGTAAMQLFWGDPRKHVRSFAFLLFVIFLIVSLVLFPARVSNAWALGVGTFASVASLWVWWIANSKQPELLDVVDPSAPVGGAHLGDPLDGDLDGFKH